MNINKFGTMYYHHREDAEIILQELLPDYPHARIVEYEIGYALQYYRSGPYYPQD